MEKLNYLNLGCGSKFHEAWYNVDMVSHTPQVIQANLLKGIPFPEHFFEVIYHSQVLEHIPKEKAPDFLNECFRVLKPGGTIRVVVPDLENIVKEYLRLLHQNLDAPTERSKADYDWIMMELYDQTVRNFDGGEMAKYLRQPHLINEDYILERVGYNGRSIRNAYLHGGKNSHLSRLQKLKKTAKNKIREARYKLRYRSTAAQIGAFRLGGEIHLWMYDRYSLSRLLQECGFIDVRQKNPFESDIPEWEKYELDVRKEKPYDPSSLFMEARKPD